MSFTAVLKIRTAVEDRTALASKSPHIAYMSKRIGQDGVRIAVTREDIEIERGKCLHSKIYQSSV